MKLYLNRFINIFTIVNILSSLLLFVQAILYNKWQIMFLSIYEFRATGMNTIMFRNDSVRITYMGTMISLSAIISICMWLTRKRKFSTLSVMHLINIGLSIIYFLYVSQTRMYIFAIALVFFYLLYINMPQLFSNKIIRACIVGVCVVGVAFLVGLDKYLYGVIEPLLDGSYNSIGSYYARIYAIEYLSEIIQQHPFMGLGIFSPDRSSIYYSLVHSVQGYVTYTDVGLLGSTAKFGLPILIWYLHLIIMMWKTCKKTSSILAHGLFMFCIVTSATLIIIDPQRMGGFVLILSIFEALNTEVPLIKNNFYKEKS